MTTESEGPGRGVLRVAIGWIALLALDGYVTFLHQGLGWAPGGFASAWWHPTQYLLLDPTVGGWADVPAQGTLYLALPAAAITAVVFWGTGSAIARTLAVSFTVAAIMIGFVGFAAEGAWEIFHIRMSAVIGLISLSIGVAIMSPALTAAWLRRGVALRLLFYLPVAFAVVALMRNATGTDEALPGNFSPWPGITVVGLELGAYTVVGILFGLAIGLAAAAQWGKRTALAGLGLVIACAFPAIWFHQRFEATDAGPLLGLMVLTAVALAIACFTGSGERSARLGRRATVFTLGAALVITPIIAGRAWAAADYTVNKFVRARIATDALAAYFEKEGEYPEELEILTEQGYLEELPRPRVGFGFLYDLGFLPPNHFSYRNLGSSYVLEFNSTEWVQCAYNPPWSASGGGSEYEDEYDEEYADEDDEAGEAWSCPDTRPALWGNDSEGDEYEYEYEEDEYDEDEYEEDEE